MTTVPGGMGRFDGSCTLASGDNWSASGDFYVTVDYGLPTEEAIECSSVSGTTVNFAQRGAAGTTAVAHDPGCVIFVSSAPQDDDEANQAVASTLGAVTTVGDMLYANAIATNANTLTRLGLGTAGQVVQAGASAPKYASTLPLVGVDGTLTGSAPSAPGPFSFQAGTHSVTFSGGSGTLTFPTAFANGVLSLTCTATGSGTGSTVVSVSSSSKTAATLLSGALSGSLSVSYFAVGF